MDTTDSPFIKQSQWFTSPITPLLENKIYAARIGNLIYYITAERGMTRMAVNANVAKDKPIAVEVQETEDIKDNSIDKFNQLLKFITSVQK